MNNIRTTSNYTDYAQDWRSTTTSASPYLEQLQPNTSWSSNVSRDIDPNRSTAFSNEKHEILVTDLPSYVDSETMKIILDRQGFKALHTKVDTLTIEGTIRFHGILEFRDEKTAREWIDYNEGYLKFSDGVVSKMEYMNDGNEPDTHSNRNFNNREREKPGPSSPIWTCAKCAMNNSNERHECFKCGTSIIETRDLEEKGDTLVGTVLCDTLLIRDLPRNVTETDIRSISKRYALVQMNDSIEAGYLLNVFNKIAPYINNDRVIVTFSKQSLNLLAIQEGMSLIRNKEGYSINSQARQKYASVSDQAYMQSARGCGDYEQHISGVEKSKTINTPFGVRKIFPQPNPKTFQLESSSGYYYDQDTGFYYDPSTEFYYDPQIQQWAFYCKRYSTYIPCEGGDEKLKKRLMDEEDEDDEVKVVENRYIPPKPARRIATPPRMEKNISTMRHGDVQIPIQPSWYDRMTTSPHQAKRIPTPPISQLGRIPTQPDRYERVANSSRQEINLAYSWSERVASPPNEKRRSYEHRGASPPAKFLRRKKSPVRGKPRMSPETINQDAEEKITLAMDMIKTCNEQNRLLFQVLGNKLTDEDRRIIKNFESEISYICQAAEPLKEAQVAVKRTMEIWKKYDKVQDREEKREKINSWINPLPERRRESWNEREESSVMPKSKKASTWKENLPSRPRPPSRNPPVPRYEERRSDPDSCPGEPFIDPLMQGPIRRELEWRSRSPPRNLDTWKPSAPIFSGPTQPLEDDWLSRKSPGPRLRRWEDSRVEKTTTRWQEKRPSSRDRPINVAEHIPEFSRKESSPKLLTKGILKREGELASRDESRDTWKSTRDLAGPSKIESDWRTNSAAIHALQGNLLSQPQEKLIAQQSGNLLAQQLMALAQQQMASAAAPFLIMPNPLLAQNFMAPSAGGLALQTPSALISGPKPVMSNSLQQYASNERDWQIALSQDQKKRAPIRIEDPVQSRPRRAATSVRAMPGTKATVKRERADMPREPARVQKEARKL
uniref:RanBP2-type domain-containing protein n=1 Tax=Acrobeloides nanus TaxID=290746 RepID=A0A914BXS4_9BILA